MDTLPIYLLLAGLLIVSAILFLRHFRMLRRETARMRRCADCAHFSLEAGQAEMRKNPSFTKASTVLTPWQMGHAKDDPWHKARRMIEHEYEAQTSDLGKVKLAKQLAAHDKTKPPPEDYIPPAVLEIGWEDFGACAKYRELRAKTDKCDDYVGRA